jgi:hypothetical protein
MQAWTRHFMVSPAELFRAASESSHAGVFTEAWAKRILYEENKEFATAWLVQFSQLKMIDTPKSPFNGLETDAYELFDMLSWYEVVEILQHYTKDS